MIKLVVSDLDETLLDDNSKITKLNIEAIKLLKEKSIPFGIASGRSKDAVKRLTKQLGFYNFLDFIISYNGVSMYEIKEKMTYNDKFLDKEIIKNIYDSLKILDVSFVVHKNDTIICNKATEYTEGERINNQYEQIIVKNFEQALDMDYPKLMIIGTVEVLDQAINILNKFENNNFNFFKTHKNYLEIVSENLSKGKMLKQLCDKNSIELKNVLAIGDNYNDLDMIKVSGYGVAVENAVGRLKQNASLVVSSNNESGFAEAINYHIK